MWLCAIYYTGLLWHCPSSPQSPLFLLIPVHNLPPASSLSSSSSIPISTLAFWHPSHSFWVFLANTLITQSHILVIKSWTTSPDFLLPPPLYQSSEVIGMFWYPSYSFFFPLNTFFNLQSQTLILMIKSWTISSDILLPPPLHQSSKVFGKWRPIQFSRPSEFPAIA